MPHDYLSFFFSRGKRELITALRDRKYIPFLHPTDSDTYFLIIIYRICTGTYRETPTIRNRHQPIMPHHFLIAMCAIEHSQEKNMGDELCFFTRMENLFSGLVLWSYEL